MNDPKSIISRAIKFNSLEAAIRFVEGCNVPSKFKVVLGDSGQYWVVTNREASILISSGYELAEQ